MRRLHCAALLNINNAFILTFNMNTFVIRKHGNDHCEKSDNENDVLRNVNRYKKIKVSRNRYRQYDDSFLSFVFLYGNETFQFR